MIKSPINTSNRQAMENAFNTLEEKLNADVFVNDPTQFEQVDET